MKGACYIMAIVLTIVWLVAWLFFKTGGVIHILLLAAAISWIHGIIICPKKEKVTTFNV